LSSTSPLRRGKWLFFLVPLAALAAAQTRGLAPDLERSRSFAQGIGTANDYHQLGQSLLAAGDRPAAVESFRAALERDETLAPARAGLADALSFLGDRAGAEEAYRRALRGEDMASARNGLGNLLALEGRAQDAVAEYRRAIELDPELRTARANLGAARDSLVQARYAHQAALRALELVLGRYPAAELRARPDLPPLPGPVPAGLPLQMLERRPDLIAAERRVAAAFNRVGQAKAVQLPSIRLTGSVGYIDSDILQLKQDYDNPSAGVGAKLFAPLYTGGGLEAQVELATAQQREALAQYARLALRAIGDVEESLAIGRTLAEREVLLRAVSADQRRALDLAQTAYRVGKQDLRSVEQQALSLYATRVNLLRVHGEQLNQRVALHLALGGSFGAPVVLSDARAP